MKTLSKSEVMALPLATQEKVMDTLKAYDKVYVTFQDGEFRTSVGIAITATYSKDHKVVGEVRAEDMYTKEERYKNYEEEFGYMPRVKIFG